VEKTFDDLQHEANKLVTRYGARNEMLEDLRKMFHMEWQEAPKNDWIQPTMSPDAYNTCIGAIRLLTATEPQVSVPFEESNDDAKNASETLEKAARAMLAGSKRVIQRPAHYEIVFSATLFGEVCMGITKTADMLKMANETKINATIRRMEDIARRTPYIFQVWNPETCYPDFDGLGLRAMLRRADVAWGEVLDMWGDAADVVGQNHKRDDRVKINEWYDWGTHAVWIDQSKTPIYFDDNELGFLPVIAQVAEGSFMFDNPERQRLPLLYALYKSGLWRRQNLSLTVLFSLVYAIGSVPLWKRKTIEPGKPLQITRDGPIGVLDVGPDEDIQPFAEKVVDQAVVQAMQIAQSLGEQSTLNKVALGQPLKGATFSTVSLLAASGRLPLVSPKQISGDALAMALETAMRWLKADGKKESIYTRTGAVAIDPAIIPENLLFEVNLEPDLPQDKLQQANAGQMIKATGLASSRWVRENILNIGQSSAMDKEVWMEKRMDAELQGMLALVQTKYQQMAQQMAAQQQQAMAQQQQAMAQQPASQQQPGGMPGQQMQPEQGMSPEEMAAAMGESMGPEGSRPPGGELGPGAPMQGPMRPRGPG
jgi:hypothetical protein